MTVITAKIPLKLSFPDLSGNPDSLHKELDARSKNCGNDGLLLILDNKEAESC
jgi:hypothetical protein